MDVGTVTALMFIWWVLVDIKHELKYSNTLKEKDME